MMLFNPNDWPCLKSWGGSVFTGGTYLLAQAQQNNTLANLALIVAILSGLATFTLTMKNLLRKSK